MHWFFILSLLCSAFYSASEATHDQKKPPSAVIVGTVYCDTCFQDDFSWNSHFISGASVAVECKGGNSTGSFRHEVRTDEHGEFKVQLPFSVSKHVKKIRRCSVKLLRSNEPNCAVASIAKSSSLRLKSRKQGLHIFSAGFFSFKPEKQPILCNQKPSIHNAKDLKAQKDSLPTLPPFTNPTFPPPLQDPPTPDLPPLNQNHILPPLPLLPKLPPLPELPPLPNLPQLPGFPPHLPQLPGFPPIPEKPKNVATGESLKKVQLLSDKKSLNSDLFFPTPPVFPPNPFQPPLVFPPNPLQPPPLFPPIPNPLQPPPAPLIPLPPIPGLTPSPPPPLIPSLPPFPFPPFPFPPGSPGVPPASSSSQKTSP